METARRPLLKGGCLEKGSSQPAPPTWPWVSRGSPLPTNPRTFRGEEAGSRVSTLVGTLHPGRQLAMGSVSFTSVRVQLRILPPSGFTRPPQPG